MFFLLIWFVNNKNLVRKEEGVLRWGINNNYKIPIRFFVISTVNSPILNLWCNNYLLPHWTIARIFTTFFNILGVFSKKKVFQSRLASVCSIFLFFFEFKDVPIPVPCATKLHMETQKDDPGAKRLKTCATDTDLVSHFPIELVGYLRRFLEKNTIKCCRLVCKKWLYLFDQILQRINSIIY